METTTNNISLYLAGPMRGYPDKNHKAFADAERMWRNNSSIGEIFNPAKEDERNGILPDDTELSREALKACMERDIEALFQCNAIYMMRGWERSEGARVEHALAVYLKLLVIYES